MKHVFIDMDGVLCDFMGGVLKLFGITPDEIYPIWPRGEYDFAKVLEVPENEIWRRISAGGLDWWESLEPCHEGGEIIGLLGFDAPFTVLTSPSLDPQCAAGKVAWLQKHYGRGFRRYFIGPQKALLAGSGRLLIDDCDKNVSEFIAAGGSAYLVPRPWNSNHSQSFNVSEVQE